MRRLLSLVVVAFLIGIVPASAQYRPSSMEGWMYYLQGDMVHMIQADQMDYVRQSMNIGRRAQMRNVTDDLMTRGDYIGLNTPNGFYPVAQCNKGQRIARYAVDAGVGALLGAVFGGKKGAIVGGAVGGAVGVHEDLKCWSVQNNNVRIVGLNGDDEGNDQTMVVQLPDTMSQPRPQVQSPVRENGWNERMRQQNEYRPVGGSVDPDSVWTIRNLTKGNVELYDGNTFLTIMRPGSSYRGPNPKSNYVAVMLVLNEHGSIETIEAVFVPRPYGLDITTPRGDN